MKTRTVIALASIAALAGFFVGTHRSASPTTSQSDEPVRASDNGSIAIASRVASTTPASERSLPPRHDPTTAIGEEVDAMRHGDVSAVARSIVLTVEARALIERAAASAPPEFVREYPTAELLAAFVFCGAQRIEGFRVVSTTYEQPDRAKLQIAFKFASEPEWRTEEVAFKQIPSGWCRVIDIGLARRVAAIVGNRNQ